MNTKAKRILSCLANQKHRNHRVGEINWADQDEQAQVGKDQEIKTLAEMNGGQDSTVGRFD
jgi:hypothetical protein